MVNSTIVQWKWIHSGSPLEVNYFEKPALLGFFISQICWVFVLWIVTYSILAFYWRLFSCNGRLTRFAIWTITVAVLCWGISVVRLVSLIGWLFYSIETMVAESNKGLAVHNDLPMFSYRFITAMGLQQRTYSPGMQWGRHRISPP